MAKTVTPVGERYGYLTVLREGTPHYSKRSNGRQQKNRRWLVRCDCGVEVELLASNVRNGRQVRCGNHLRRRRDGSRFRRDHMASQKTGTSGYLIIEDNGSVVTFRIQNTQGATYANGKSWSGVVNGVGVGGTFSISGAQTVTLGSWAVGYTQTVTLIMGATGTSGLSGPSSFSVGIFRATAPGAPVPVAVDEPTPTSLRYRFSGTTDGGSAITGWQAQVATNAAFTTGVQTVTSNGTTTFTNLNPSTTYYFRSRGLNAVGWGAWSAVISGMTASGAYVSLNGVWVPVPVYVSNGSAWGLPELLVSDGTAWEEAI